MTTDWKRLIGTGGTLVKFVEEARAAIKAADLPATNQVSARRGGQTRLAADDLRRSLPAIRDSLEQLRDSRGCLRSSPSRWSMVQAPEGETR